MLNPELRGLAIVIYKPLFGYMAHPKHIYPVHYAANIRNVFVTLDDSFDDMT